MQGIDEAVIKRVGLPRREAKLGPWREMMEISDNVEQRVRIGVLGKYIDLQDAYTNSIGDWDKINCYRLTEPKCFHKCCQIQALSETAPARCWLS